MVEPQYIIHKALTSRTSVVRRIHPKENAYYTYQCAEYHTLLMRPRNIVEQEEKEGEE